MRKKRSETTWLLALAKTQCGGTPRLLGQDNFDDLPFNQMGGLGRAYELFGDSLSGILDQ